VSVGRGGEGRGDVPVGAQEVPLRVELGEVVRSDGSSEGSRDDCEQDAVKGEEQHFDNGASVELGVWWCGRGCMTGIRQ